jgi:hypothetical protein
VGVVDDRFLILLVERAFVLARPQDYPLLAVELREAKDHQHLRVRRIEHPDALAIVG